MINVAAYSRSRTIVYWVTTLVLATECVVGGVMGALRLSPFIEINGHSGYSDYFMTILGVWKLPCAVALLVPRFGRLKEWAYAGAFFNYSGAVASHALVGDGPNKWGPPLGFAVVTLASWALRPPGRRIARTAPAAETRAVAWVVPIVILVLLLVLSLVTLPKGPPP